MKVFTGILKGLFAGAITTAILLIAFVVLCAFGACLGEGCTEILGNACVFGVCQTISESEYFTFQTCLYVEIIGTAIGVLTGVVRGISAQKVLAAQHAAAKAKSEESQQAGLVVVCDTWQTNIHEAKEEWESTHQSLTEASAALQNLERVSFQKPQELQKKIDEYTGNGDA